MRRALVSRYDAFSLCTVGTRGHALGDSDAQLAQGLHFRRVVGDQADRLNAQVAQHVGSRRVVALVGMMPQLQVCIDGVVADILQIVGAQFGKQPDAAPFLPQIEDDAGALDGDHAHGARELFAAVAAQRAEHIAGETFGMHTG
jgi:hypothetical protein